ncbi:MAG TPA: UvrD-helicase domain-containing protein [Syntrophomonadaceae bacterium]|nr:UvrD-helicase domain-containing protein [Syntrophomonadaceae bacterium]
MTWLVEREKLTTEQLRAIEMSWDRHRLIIGAPGSGKTQILMHRAHYLVHQLKVEPERFHIFVYTKILKEYLRSNLFLLDLPESSVSTFDSWCVKFYRNNIKHSLPKVDNSKAIDFDKLRSSVLVFIKRHANNYPIYDFVMVDEGQDLDKNVYEILKRIAKHITICADDKQQIYEMKCQQNDILKALDMRRANITLLEAFRCSPYIVELAARFIPDSKEREMYINQGCAYQSERLTPLLYYAKDIDDEKKRMADIIRTRIDAGDRIGVLFPQKRMVYGFAQGMREVDLEVETMDELDVNNDLPKFITYHSVKGLTFDTIIMPRLHNWGFKNISKDKLVRLLFVGITRATKWVYLSAEENKELEVLDLLEGLDEQGVLTIQRHNDIQGENQVENDSKEDQLRDDLLDLI